MKENTFSFSLYSSISSRWVYNVTKRFFDVFASLVVMILLSPVLGFIALAIKHDSPGPVFYRGKRIGYRGKIFSILKFRTMYESDASYAGPKVTAKDDSRITPLGHWLRNTKINEFPQFWNVLKGDMSLVGPRPEDPDIAEQWPEDVRESILSVRPGITSPASVQYHNEEMLLVVSNVLQKYIEELGPDKIRLDDLYVRYRSFWLDLDTLFWTFIILLPRIGMNNPPEELLFVGPFTRLIRRYLNWFVIDFMVTLTAIIITGVSRRVAGPLDVGWLKSSVMALGFALIFSLTGAVLGVNRITWSKATLTDAYDLLPAWALASVIGWIVNQTVGIFSYKIIIAASALTLIGYIAVRFRARLFGPFFVWLFGRWNGGLLGRERVLLVGSGSTAQHAAWLLSHPTNNTKYQIVGIVDDDLFKQGTRVYGSKVVGMVKDLPSLVEKLDVNVILLADHRQWKISCRPVLDAYHKKKTRVVVLPDFLTTFNNLTNPTPMIPITSSQGSQEEDFPCLECMTRYASSQPELQQPEGKP